MAIETIEISDASEIVATGNGQIAEIEASIKDLEVELNAIQIELDDIAQARATQVDTLDSERLCLLTLEQAYGQAKSYAELATGTGRERHAIADCATAKQTYLQARKGLEKLTRQIEADNRSAEISEQELRERKHLCNAEMETLYAEITDVQAGMVRAKEELGREIYETAIARYSEMSGLIASMRTALVDAQTEQRQIWMQALEDLTAWPEVQRAIRNLQEPDDSTWRIIVATLAYVDALLLDGHEVRYGLDPLPWDLRDVLHVREMELREKPSLINNDRKRRLEQTRDAYLTLMQAR